MKSQEIREMQLEQLQSKLLDAREELLKLRFQQVTGQLTDTSRLRIVRRDIARMVSERLRPSLARDNHFLDGRVAGACGSGGRGHYRTTERSREQQYGHRPCVPGLYHFTLAAAQSL